MRKYQDLSGKKIGRWENRLKKRMERFLTIAPAFVVRKRMCTVTCSPQGSLYPVGVCLK